MKQENLSGPQPHVLYFAHDLDDSAIWRRVAMLEAGGAKVSVVGFRRGNGDLPGPARVIGRTADARMAQRIGAVARAFVGLRSALRGIGKPDVIMARNLEMLAIATRARRIWNDAVLVYEVLDIHRMMLGEGKKPKALRALERKLGRDVDLVLTSSPAFIGNYFRRYDQLAAPVELVENKVLRLGHAPVEPDVAAEQPAPPPLVIGWFGILRCSWSLRCLDRVTRSAPGRYKVVMRGKPARDVLPAFDEIVAANPDLEFRGAYRAPDDLSRIYGEVHLSWLVDRFDAGANSDWLLPNRLYEGCLHGAVPLTLDGTEISEVLARHEIGFCFAADPGALAGKLADLTPDRLAAARSAVARVPSAVWVSTRDDCRSLVQTICHPGQAQSHSNVPMTETMSR